MLPSRRTAGQLSTLPAESPELKGRWGSHTKKQALHDTVIRDFWWNNNDGLMRTVGVFPGVYGMKLGLRSSSQFA